MTGLSLSCGLSEQISLSLRAQRLGGSEPCLFPGALGPLEQRLAIPRHSVGANECWLGAAPHPGRTVVLGFVLATLGPRITLPSAHGEPWVVTSWPLPSPARKSEVQTTDSTAKP